ncbi:MAG: baseplate J/gp47 family protein [Acidobacteriota bacterium]|nr:MAG: baseplate J/gp47 family protein [Acidobacteriota bacterium]
MIEYPQIEIRNAERFAAEAIAKVSGGLTPERVALQIEERRELLKLIEAGLNAPVCPELTNANPSSPHTVILEAIAWALDQQAYRFNRVPEQNLIAFANLFGLDRRPATAAETVLRFTVDPPADTDVTIPAETEVSTVDGRHVFQTTEAVTIPFGTPSGDVAARRTVTGRTLLSPDVLTTMIDNVAFVESVTNPNAIDDGTDLEPIPQTLERVRRYQRRGERLVSTRDLEDAIRDEALGGTGIVRAFPFVKNGEFGPQVNRLVGFTSIVVMTASGDPIDGPTRARVGQLLDQAVGNQFIYIVDPAFVTFNVAAAVRVYTGAPEGGVLTAIETNLRSFYAASKANFGRPILRSEIIAVIEGTEGVDRIVANDTDILGSPTVDTRLAEFQLPRLVEVTIDAV